MIAGKGLKGLLWLPYVATWDTLVHQTDKDQRRHVIVSSVPNNTSSN